MPGLRSRGSPRSPQGRLEPLPFLRNARGEVGGTGKRPSRGQPLEHAALVGERLGTEGGGVRLERVRSAPHLVRVAALGGFVKRRDELRRLREERVYQRVERSVVSERLREALE